MYPLCITLSSCVVTVGVSIRVRTEGLASSGGLSAKWCFGLSCRGACSVIGLGGEEFVPSFLGKVMNSIPVEAGEPEGAGDVSGGVAAATVGALGCTEVSITFTAGWAVYMMAVEGVVAPTFATNDAVSATEAGIMPPLLALGAHRDNVLVNPS